MKELRIYLNKKLVSRLIHIHGKVQNVGFRFFTQQIARKFGIGGYTKNLGDGSVEVEAHGESSNMQMFLNELRIGSPASRVDDIVNIEIPNKLFTDFIIKY